MKKTVNLYDVYRKEQKKSRQVSKGTGLMILMISVALIMGAYMVRLYLDISLLKGHVNNLESYINNPSNVQKYDEAMRLATENESLSTLISNMNEVNTVLREKDDLSSRILMEIWNAKPSSMTIESMSVSESHVSLVFTSKKQEDAARFIATLKESYSIKAVDYIGYEFDEVSETYKATATLVLRGNF